MIVQFETSSSSWIALFWIMYRLENCYFFTFAYKQNVWPTHLFNSFDLSGNNCNHNNVFHHPFLEWYTGNADLLLRRLEVAYLPNMSDCYQYYYMRSQIFCWNFFMNVCMRTQSKNGSATPAHWGRWKWNGNPEIVPSLWAIFSTNSMLFGSSHIS